MPRGRPAKGAKKGQPVKAAADEVEAEMRNSEKVRSENDGDDDALDVIMQGLYLQPFT
jgi:hypothetical protein